MAFIRSYWGRFKQRLLNHPDSAEHSVRAVHSQCCVDDCINEHCYPDYTQVRSEIAGNKFVDYSYGKLMKSCKEDSTSELCISFANRTVNLGMKSIEIYYTNSSSSRM